MPKFRPAMLVPFRWLMAVLLLFFQLVSACRGQEETPASGAETAALKEVQQQQRTNDHIVTLLNDTGSLKQGSNQFVLEFRNATTNALVNVSNLKVESSMQMPGTGPMIGTVSVGPLETPGRYNVTGELGMAGQWNLVATFDPNQRVQFTVNAQ